MDTTRKITIAIGALIAVGVALILGGLSFDGFGGGLLQGAGFGMSALGCYALGMHHRASRPDGPGQAFATWLPSRGDPR